MMRKLMEYMREPSDMLSWHLLLVLISMQACSATREAQLRRLHEAAMEKRIAAMEQAQTQTCEVNP